MVAKLLIWRRERDSNPRYGLTPYDGLANPCLKGWLSQPSPCNPQKSAISEPRKARKGRERIRFAMARKSAQSLTPTERRAHLEWRRMVG